MRVKICGITNLEDALKAIELGADAIGFIFWEKSKRFIEFKKAKEIIKRLPPSVERVGVFVNKTANEINKISKDIGLSLVQIHFEVDSSFFDKLNVKYLKVVRAKSKDDIKKYENEYRLIDAFVKEYGGSGKRIPLDWFEGVDRRKIILAGGVGKDNIKKIKKMGFFGVDLSSSVEKEPGKKDFIKLKEFFECLKE